MGWTTKTITGRKWDTIPEFEADHDILKIAITLPTPAVTTVIMAYNENPDPLDPDTPTFYYIGEQDEIDAVLGAPYTFDIDVYYED